MSGSRGSRISNGLEIVVQKMSESLTSAGNLSSLKFVRFVKCKCVKGVKCIRVHRAGSQLIIWLLDTLIDPAIV